MHVTRNIKFVAYLRYKKVHPDKVDKFSRGKANYSFEMHDDSWARWQKEFDQSEFITYAQCLDAIQDLAY